MDKNEYVSLVRIPRQWFFVFVWSFSILLVVHTAIDLFFDFAWNVALGDTLFIRMSVLMTLIVGWFFIVSHIWEALMLGYAKAFKDKVRAEGKAEGKTELLDALETDLEAGLTLEEALEKYQYDSKSAEKSKKNVEAQTGGNDSPITPKASNPQTAPMGQQRMGGGIPRPAAVRHSASGKGGGQKRVSRPPKSGNKGK